MSVVFPDPFSPTRKVTSLSKDSAPSSRMMGTVNGKRSEEFEAPLSSATVRRCGIGAWEHLQRKRSRRVDGRYIHGMTSPSPSSLPARADALALMHEYTASDSLRKHMLSVEAAMRAYAEHFGEDADRWGLAGLIHDFDYE